MSIYTPTEYNATAASPPMNATNMLKSEYGIQKVSREATPLSALSRVMCIDGNGIPTFPDNVAGASVLVYPSASNTWSSWIASHGAKSVANGIMRATATTTEAGLQTAIDIDNKLCVLRLRASKEMVLTATAVVGSDYIVVGYLSVGVYWRYVTVFKDLTGSSSQFYFMNGSLTAGDWIEMDSAYIGSGLFDTPVYGLDGQSVWTNYGVVPVNGKRGKAMLFQGAQWLKGNGPMIGATGTLRFRIKTSATLDTGFLLSNRDQADTKGMVIYCNADGSTVLGFGGVSGSNSIGTLAPSTEYTFSLSISASNVNLFRNGAFISSLPLASAPAAASDVLFIGTDSDNPSAGSNLAITIDDISFVAEAETLDSHIRYHNGDDAVDCQQKAVSPTPNAIMCRDDEGMTYQAYLTKTGTSAGVIGAMCFDASYLYICTALNTWKRVSLTSY